ncbi:hypothetical protein D3C87_1432070 [compost metagenome]
MVTSCLAAACKACSLDCGGQFLSHFGSMEPVMSNTSPTSTLRDERSTCDWVLTGR